MAKKRNIESASVFERSGIRAIRVRLIEVLLYNYLDAVKQRLTAERRRPRIRAVSSTQASARPNQTVAAETRVRRRRRHAIRCYGNQAAGRIVQYLTRN